MATAPGFTGSAGAPNSSYDVAIFGAGLTGLTAARALAKAGLDVAVFERGVVGDGASGRNGGHLYNGIAHSYAAAMRQLGRDTARDLYQAFDASIDQIEGIIAEENIACDLRRSGKLKLAAKTGHIDALRKNADLLKIEADPDVAFLGKSDFHSEIRSDRVFAGVLFPKSAQMHMGAYLHELAKAVEAHGGAVFEKCPVLQTKRVEDCWQVTLSDGQVSAKHLILAGGMTGAHLSKHIARQVLPIGSYIITTRPLTEAEIAATLPEGRTYVTSLNVGSYFRLSPDKRLVFGGRARFSTKADARAAATSAPILSKSLAALFPSLAGIEIDYAFGGLVDMSRDRFPRLGQTPDGALYAIGLFGHGAQISSYMGIVLARYVLDPKSSHVFAELKSNPFPPGTIWTLPLIGALARFHDLVT